LSATPASAGVTTYHNPDTGAVTIASAASITLDSNAISIDDPDGDTNPDTVDITTAIPVSFSLTANRVGLSLVFTGGSVNVGPPGTITVADTDSTANVAITASVPGVSIPNTPLTVAGSDLYRTYGTITCTFSGTIPIVGTLPGTVDCTSEHNLVINIHNDGGAPEVTRPPVTVPAATWVDGVTSTFHNGMGGVTITITSSPSLTTNLEPPPGVDLDNDGSTDDAWDVTKQVDTTLAPITGTLVPAVPQLTITGGIVRDTGFHSVDINNDEAIPSDDVQIRESNIASLPPPATVSLTAVPTLLNNIRFEISASNLGITTNIVDPATGEVEGTLSGPFTGAIDLSNNGAFEEPEEAIAGTLTATFRCTRAWPTASPTVCDIAITYDGLIDGRHPISGTFEINDGTGSSTLSAAGVVTWNSIATTNVNDAVGGDFQISNSFVSQVFDGVVDSTADPNNSNFEATQNLVGPIHVAGGLTATWRDTTAEIGNVGNLFIEISLSNAVIEGLIQDVSVGSLTATIAADEAGPGIINIVIQSPDGPMYTVTDESAVGTLWCSNVWPPGSTGECRLQITWSGRWNTRPISGVITSVTSGSALDGGTSAITDTTEPTMRISGFNPDSSFVAGLFILNEDGAVTGTIDPGALTGFSATLSMTGPVMLVGRMVGVTFTATVEIGTVTVPGVTFTFDSDVFTAVVDPNTGHATGTFSVIGLTATIPGFGTLIADGTGYLDCIAPDEICDITIDFTGTLDGQPASGQITLIGVGLSTAGIQTDGTISISFSGGVVGGQMTVDVTSTVPGLIHDGDGTVNSMDFFSSGPEAVFADGELILTGQVDVGTSLNNQATGTLSFSGVGIIDNDNRYAANVRGSLSLSVSGWGTVVADFVGTLTCIDLAPGPTVLCSLSGDFDGSMGATNRISGSIVVSNFEFTATAGSTFFSMTELEEMLILGTAPTKNVWVDLDRDGERDDPSELVPGPAASVVLEGGILRVGPITNATIASMFFDGSSHFYRLGPRPGSDTILLKGRANGTTIAGFTIVDETTFEVKMRTFSLDVNSFVVPLQDMSNDDRELDDRLFGGYDDFALTGTGMVYITAWVHDIAFKPVDNMGNTLPASNTAVTLIRYNGGPITRGSGSNPDQFQSNLAWSYSQWAGAETGYAIFYQLPGDQPYGVTVTFDNRPVYDEPYEIEKLTETVIAKLVAQVYKLKLVVIDCTDTTVPEAWLRYIEPGGRTVTTRTGPHGDLDFGLIGGGEITVKSIWWKGFWIGFDKATIGSTELPVAADGSVKITIDRNIDSPVVLRAVINDLIFTTWDFNKDNKIPRLNITLAWVGVHPLTGKRMYFVETMDPTGDTNPDPFNTTVIVSQFFSYDIDHFFGQASRSAGLKTYGDVRYKFYKMPSTLYNITVTTVTDPRYDTETEQTPGSSKWPGRTDAPVDYEIKIDWRGLDSPPSVRRTPHATVNDRVVLRVFMAIGGQLVTDPALNPIGNATLYRTCGPVRVDLLTWAHTWYQRIVDGDFDYLKDARRIGNATYRIVNDNGREMELYLPAEAAFTPEFRSKWTEDTLLTTWLRANFQAGSIIWWNGTYRKQNLAFFSYVYPLEFGRGEQPWARFYDKVGLTGTGWNTTVRKEADDPLAFVVNRFFNVTTPRRENATWLTHNFTIVGNEALWRQQVWRWERWVAAAPAGTVREVPYRPYSLVFEKEVLVVPIPVGFITLNLKDEDLARPVPYAVVQLDIFGRPTNTTHPSSSTVVRHFGYKYKVGREGNLTLLYPTQEMMENILSGTSTLPRTPQPHVINYTLTVYWYLNSSIVYKDAFNLTKRGYNVDKVAIADVTFVLAISADKDRPVKDLYARIWWLNVADGSETFPGRITVDHARKTWTYTAVPETRGAAKWTEGKLTLPWLPTSERFTKSDYDLEFDTATKRWIYRDVTRSWDIPFPTNSTTGVGHPGWPYQPKPTGYYRALNFTQNARIQYRVSVWSDQLPIDPTSPSYNNGAWLRDHYELVWRQPSYFGFAWMLFGHPPFDITFYRGNTSVGEFRPIPGYALTRTWEKTPTPGSKTVAIKLNATDIQIPVFWQVGDYELGTYDCGPLVGYKVKGSVIPPKGATFSPITIDRTTAAGTITVGDKKIDICLAGKPVGFVSLRSGDTPSTVIWGGSTLRITEVSPPDTIWADSTSPAAGKGTSSDYWKNWVGSATDPVTGKKVSEELVTGTQIAGPDLGIQYMGYGVPFEGAPREHKVIAFSNDPDNRAHRPFIKMFEFQNVSARITDFNGRALPGAFYQLIDSQTGKSAAWSYAGPEGRVVPMPIRKPGGVFIQRVFYLGQGPNGVPTWPVNSFAKWPVAYDSREDETTQETQKPDIPLGFAYTGEAGPWPGGPGWRGEICRQAGDGVYNYVRATLEALASCPPSGWGRSFDVITRIFDLRLRFVYGDAQRPADPYYEFSAPSLALPDQFKIKGQGAIFDAKRLARGTYDIVAYWPKEGGAEVGRRTVDISRSNVGTVEGTVVLALRDVSFTVVDRQGRPLSGARVSVSPDLVRTDDIQLRPDQIFTLLRVPDGRTYDFTIEWTSPYGTTARAAVRETPAGLQARGSIVVPVDDISVKVVDFDGRPVAGAAIKFAGQDVGSTDSQGVIIVGQVPLDSDYTISVSKEGTEIGSDRVRFTASRTSATIQAGIYDITVLVKGAAGQPIQGALVELIKGGTTIARAATDASGTAVFTKLVGADYTVRAAYEQFSSTASLAKGTRSAQITLDLYTVLLGVPMTFATFLALIIGLILLVIVVVVIVSEYIRWRGRRLGIYPAAPPKK
jgi:hypothetical protein